MNKKTQDLIKQMTIEEKLKFLRGDGFWHFEGLERLSIPSVCVQDGPHGLRKVTVGGSSESVPSVCFPTASSSACSFDTDLIKKMGNMLARECAHNGVNIILGPGANHKRSPLCGRNFEYFSEDPVLSGKITASYINGMQEEGIGTSLKHFACNSQEYYRITCDSIVDKRALHEIYLKQYEIAVKEAQPTTIMTSYNKINGIYSSENHYLMEEVARNKWGYKGLFISDWGANASIAPSYEAGLNIEMPGVAGAYENLLKENKEGKLKEEVVDKAVAPIIELSYKLNESIKKTPEFNLKESLSTAKEVSVSSQVLLKNEGSILPLNKIMKIGIIGEFAEKPRYQGAGSSIINPIYLDNFLSVLDENKISYEYEKGYSSSAPDKKARIKEAVKVAEGKDVVLFFAGLPPAYESEGFDRENLEMPKAMIDLANAIYSVNKNLVVILECGSPVSLPFIDKAKGILLTYLGGSMSAHATYDLVFGDKNPSGRLAETWPLSVKDTPCYKSYGDKYQSFYKESIYTGYRYYDKKNKEILYPFGYGLSYSEFSYSDLKVEKSYEAFKDSSLKVSLKVKNIGKVAGKEVVELYIGMKNSSVHRPIRELKAFQKIFLEPEEEKEVQFILTPSDFTYFEESIDDFYIEDGEYVIEIGKSSRDIVLNASLNVINPNKKAIKVNEAANNLYNDFSFYNLDEIDNQDFEKVIGYKIPLLSPTKPFTPNSTFYEARHTFFGRIFAIVMKIAMTNALLGHYSAGRKRAEDAALGMPIRSISMGGERFNKHFINGLVLLFNHKIFKGLKEIGMKK